MIKLRTDSTLFNLSDTQQAEIFDWLETVGYDETIKRLAAPEPDGSGIKTYRSSLHRFYLRYASAMTAQHVAEAAEVTSSPEAVQALRAATEESLDSVAFQLSTSPPDTKAFGQVSRWIMKQKAHEQKERSTRIAEDQLALARQRLALDRQKFEFDAARLALIHRAELGEIARDFTADDHAKILRARDLLFGLKPTEPATANPSPASELTHNLQP